MKLFCFFCFIFLIIFSFSSCYSLFQHYGEYSSTSNSSGSNYEPSQSVIILGLWGGNKYDVFLGFLNSSCYDSNSVWNAYGTYGSKYSSLSIWNRYGQYGSKYSNLSPWNKYSNQSPAILDSSNIFYGYFSSNKYIHDRTTIKWVVWILDNYEYIYNHLDEVRKNFQ